MVRYFVFGDLFSAPCLVWPVEVVDVIERGGGRVQLKVRVLRIEPRSVVLELCIFGLRVEG